MVVRARWSLRSLPTQAIVWLFDSSDSLSHLRLKVRYSEKIFSEGLVMHWNRLFRQVIESPSLGVQEMWRYGTEEHDLDGMMGIGWWSDMMILMIISNLNDSMILQTSFLITHFYIFPRITVSFYYPHFNQIPSLEFLSPFILTTSSKLFRSEKTLKSSSDLEGNLAKNGAHCYIKGAEKTVCL